VVIRRHDMTQFREAAVAQPVIPAGAQAPAQPKGP
jgi:hypothetical protein